LGRIADHACYILEWAIYAATRRQIRIRLNGHEVFDLKTVLFVCVENSCRSQIAEAFFNSLAPKDLRAISAGTRPSDKVNPQAVDVMKEAGLDISAKKPKLLTSEMIEKADRIITMGCGADVCPARFLPKIEDWKIEDPAGQPLEKFREVRNEIRRRVMKLIDEMTR